MIYAGIGSRETPDFMLQFMKKIGKFFGTRDWLLRSGGAKGADSAFEIGCDYVDGSKEIYYAEVDKHPEADWDGALKLVEKYHPAPYALRSDYLRLLMARNSFQVLGADLKTPAALVVCWTPDGCEDGTQTTRDTGGTGQAIRIATAYGIPVLNLQRYTMTNAISLLLEIADKGL